mgnify:CR=1 FL=1
MVTELLSGVVKVVLTIALNSSALALAGTFVKEIVAEVAAAPSF